MQVEQPDNQGFDKNFEDYAWLQMNALLDKEMPVQEKRKRRGFFLLFLLFSLLAGGAIGYRFYNASNTAVVIPKTPIAEQSQAGQKEDLMVRENKFLNNADADIEDNINAISDTKQDLKKIDNYANTSTLSKKQNTITPFLKNSQNSTSKTPTSQPETRNPKPETQNSQEDAFPALHPMNVTPIEYISSANSSFSAPPFLQTEPHRLSRWELGIEVGAIATLEGSLNPSLGINLSYGLSPKWKLRSGVNWIISEENIPFSFTSVEDLENASMDFNNNGNRFPNELADQNTDSIFTVTSKKYSFLSIPIGIDYQFHKRFSVYGGVQFLVASGNDTIPTMDAGSFTTTIATEQLNLTSERQKVRSSWQGHVGMTFQASPRWAVDFSYHHILPKQNGRNHLEQYFQLSAKYRIK